MTPDKYNHGSKIKLIKLYLYKIKYFHNGDINVQNFSYPRPSLDPAAQVEPVTFDEMEFFCFVFFLGGGGGGMEVFFFFGGGGGGGQGALFLECTVIF